MRPLVLRREVDAFVADRLLEALWREALWLVARRRRHGRGDRRRDPLRRRACAGRSWARFLTYRIAGGEAGMRHFMAQFGPALQLPWTQLTDVPELTDELLEQDRRAVRRAGRGPLRARARAAARRLPRRGAAGAARRTTCGAGAVLAALRAGAASARAPARRRRARRPARPLRLHAAVVPPEWVDYNGHAHESRYLQVFGDTTDALLRHLGVDAAYLAAGGSYFTVETHLSHLGAGARRGAAARHDAGARPRREAAARVPRAAPHGATSALLATAEQMLLHVDAATGRSGATAPGRAVRGRAARRRPRGPAAPGAGRAAHRAAPAAAAGRRGSASWRSSATTCRASC